MFLTSEFGELTKCSGTISGKLNMLNVLYWPLGTQVLRVELLQVASVGQLSEADCDSQST